MTKSYEEYVSLGKEMLSRINCYQVQIAFYATQVCTIRHGGHSKDYYTLKDYSEDIGMNRKTLSNWVNVYRCVIEKLDIDLNDVTVHDWEIATKVYTFLRKEKRAINESLGTIKAKDKGWKIETPAAKIKSMFGIYKNGYLPIEKEVHSWTDSIIGIKHKISTKNLSDASPESLMSLKAHLDKASDKVADHLLNDRGVTVTELISLKI